MALKSGRVVKTVSPSGQISLGKKYAGRAVIIEELEEGNWNIRTAQVIPDNELWLHQEPDKSKLEAGLKWVESHPFQETNLDQFEAEMLEKWEKANAKKLVKSNEV
jgi:hypothetical protein